MQLKVKVCGLKEVSNLNSIIAMSPDFIGLIFYNQSPRYVGEINDLKSIRKIDSKLTGVFVNESIETIIGIHKSYNLDYVQLHGDESVNQAKILHANGIKIIKAFQISDTFDWESINPYQEFTDIFLFDTKCHSYGGSGVKFNWHLLDNYKLNTPFILSGGIGSEDVSKLKSIKHEYLIGVDVNSRFETKPGLKNEKLVNQFIKEIRK